MYGPFWRQSDDQKADEVLLGNKHKPFLLWAIFVFLIAQYLDLCFNNKDHFAPGMDKHGICMH